MPLVPIRCAWPRFAPTIESAAIEYDPPARGRYVSLTLRVHDYAGTLVCERAVEVAEQDPLPALAWDGRLSRGVDLAVEPWATPLRSPYRITVDAVIEDDHEEPPPQPPEIRPDVVDEGMIVGCNRDAPLREPPPPPLQVEPPPPIQVEPPPPTHVDLRVEYHSLEIVRGPWNATGEEFEEESDSDVCHRLNELGYYAGPPAHVGTDGSRLAKAKERFRKNHGALRRQDAPDNHAYVEALTAAAATPRPTLTDHQSNPIAADTALPTGDGDPLRVYVEAIGWQVDLAADLDEFNGQYDRDAPTNKTTTEQRRLARPLVPLEVVIYLQDHGGGRRLAPEAVGDVRVDWSFTEPAEDVAPLPQGNLSKTGSYVEKVLGMTAGDGPRARNCLETYGGVRTAAGYHRVPFWLEAAGYAPYARAQADDGAACVYVPACVDRNHAARVGKAGLYFQPSLIAGDRYQLEAALSFAGRPNRDALQQAHEGVQLRRRTRTIVVWRRTEVLAVLGWPARGDYGAIRDRVRAAYRHAYLELDFANTRFAGADQLLQDDDLTSWIAHLRGLSQATVDRVRDFVALDHIHADSPVHLTVQPATLGLEQQLGLLMFMSNMFSELRQAPNPSSFEFLTDRIERRLRTGHPAGGLVFMDYAFTPAVRNLLTEAGLDVPTLSVGNGELNGLVDQNVPGAPYFIFAHEMGHCFWLRHHENAPANTVAAQDHDPLDHNCMMSYTTENGPAHQRADAYAPQFCGKCNLKLRGWNITAGRLLARDASDRLDIRFFYDRADPGLRATEELDSLRASVSRVSRAQLGSGSFDANADFARWCVSVSGADVYHHVSHGNQRCTQHGTRVPTMQLATPRYPLQCRSARGPRPNFYTQGPLLYPQLEQAEQDLVGQHPPFDQHRLEQWAAVHLVRPGNGDHTLRGVIQWTNDLADSSRDTEFTYDQIRTAIANHTLVPPRHLAFFSSCLLGWEPGFARLFIDGGTTHVIAFRSRYETAQALQFSQRFYREWAAVELEPARIPNVFAAAATACPHAEPVLFMANRILRFYPGTMANGSGQLAVCTWDQLGALIQPRFPQR